MALVPLAILAVLLVVIVRSRPADAVRAANAPPVERLTFQRVTLEPGAIVATVLNDGPDDVTIAQVQVDDAVWTFRADLGQSLGRTGVWWLCGFFWESRWPCWWGVACLLGLFFWGWVWCRRWG